METEAKLRVGSHDALRGRLRDAGAGCAGRALETNRLFDDARRTLFRRGCGLRVREVRDLEGRGAASSLTFKGPLQPGPFKRRPEVETELADAAAMCRLLEALGYREHIVFEKRRESWRLGDCAVELDELPVIGRFVEVEGPDEAAIRRVLRTLGLDAAESVRASYVALLAEAAPADAPAPLVFKFS